MTIRSMQLIINQEGVHVMYVTECTVSCFVRLICECLNHSVEDAKGVWHVKFLVLHRNRSTLRDGQLRKSFMIVGLLTPSQ